MSYFSEVSRITNLFLFNINQYRFTKFNFFSDVTPFRLVFLEDGNARFLQNIIIISNLSHDRSKVSSKTIPPLIADNNETHTDDNNVHGHLRKKFKFIVLIPDSLYDFPNKI